MRKNVKLTSKKSEPKPKSGGNFFFVEDQGEGAARVAVIVLKLVEIVLTTVYALCLGIFAPLIIWLGAEEVETAYGITAGIWFGSSIVYIIGLFTVMLGHSKTASVMHALASVGTLITYQRYRRLFADIPDSSGPTGLYMPCLFITLATVFIMLLINVPKWMDRRIQKLNEKAPSILGDEDQNEHKERNNLI